MKKILTLISICLLLFGCKKDKKTQSVGYTAQNVVLNSFPLAIGNSWRYYSQMTIKDSAGFTCWTENDSSYWTVIKDTIINGISCSKVLERDTNLSHPTSNVAYAYYANKSDGFYGMAIDNCCAMLYLRPGKEIKYSILGNFGGMKVDLVNIPDTALQFMKFPSNINDIWYSYEYNKPIADVIKRKWIGNASITTTAGTFDCVKLIMFWDQDHNNLPDSGQEIVYQYFSDKGLIQEEEYSSLSFCSSKDSLIRISKLVSKNF